MIDFIKYFFRIKKINLLLTFISLLNFGIMFGAEEKKEEYKIKIKFEKKDKVEKKPFTMFLENFCQTFGLNIEKFNKEDFRKSKYDFGFYYKDNDDDKIIVSTDADFEIFYIQDDLYEKKSKIGYLFLKKDEKEGNDIIKAYDEIINNEKFKNISITVYINKDLKANNEEEKKNEEKKEEDIKVNIGKNNHIEKKLNGNGDKKNNDCHYCNCCLDCFNHCWKKKL